MDVGALLLIAVIVYSIIKHYRVNYLISTLSKDCKGPMPTERGELENLQDSIRESKRKPFNQMNKDV